MAKKQEKKAETYFNLIDVCIALEEDNAVAGNAPAMFKKLLTDYFFKREIEESKKMEIFFNNYKNPAFLEGKTSLYSIDLEEFKNFIEGESVSESLCGNIMLSKNYLQSFYTHHVPDFKKLPEDIKFEIFDKVKAKNNCIIGAFQKMSEDKNADKNRKVIALVALILKNIYKKTGQPFNQLPSVDETISTTYRNCQEVFNSSQKQVSDLKSDSKIVFRPPLSAEVELRIPSVEKAANVLGFRAAVDLDEGIRRTAEWYRHA